VRFDPPIQAPLMHYSTSAGNQRCDYSLVDGILEVSMSGGVSLQVPLRTGNVAIKRTRVFSTWFRIGMAVFAIAAFTLTVTTIKEGGFKPSSLGPYGYVHIGLVIGGFVLALMTCRPRLCCLVTVDGDGIAIWQDPANPGKFEEFMKEVEDAARPLIAA